MKDVDVTGAQVLGGFEVPGFSSTEEGLRITIDKEPAEDKPLCFKIRLK